MKAEDLKFPMVVKWNYNSIYTVVEGRQGLDWTSVGDDPTTFKNSINLLDLVDAINKGGASVLAQPQQTTSLSQLTVDVDTSALTRATQAAQELEDALKAVKDMLA